METIYRKVAVSEEPKRGGDYLTDLGKSYFNSKTHKWEDYYKAETIYPEWWLEEIDLTQLKKYKEDLEAWKESAMQVMSDLSLQELGKLLNVKLGTSVSEQILPSVKTLLKDKEELIEGLDKIFKVGYKPYRNTRNEELEIIDIARNLLNKFQKQK